MMCTPEKKGNDQCKLNLCCIIERCLGEFLQGCFLPKTFQCLLKRQLNHSFRYQQLCVNEGTKYHFGQVKASTILLNWSVFTFLHFLTKKHQGMHKTLNLQHHASKLSANLQEKMDNGHGLVAHSAQVPPYSTQLLISKLGIMFVPLLIDLNVLIKSSQVTINQKDHVLVVYLYHHGTMMSSYTIHRTSNICFASCFSTHVCSPLLLEA